MLDKLFLGFWIHLYIILKHNVWLIYEPLNIRLSQTELYMCSLQKIKINKIKYLRMSLRTLPKMNSCPRFHFIILPTLSSLTYSIVKLSKHSKWRLITITVIYILIIIHLKKNPYLVKKSWVFCIKRIMIMNMSKFESLPY